METQARIAVGQHEYLDHMDYWKEYYPALQAARETAWKEYEAAAADVGREMKMRVLLVYDAPVRLYHAGRTRHKTAREHKVKRLFAKDNRHYYIPTACRTNGYRLAWDHLTEIRILTEEKDYSAEWAHIAKSMREYNINLDLAKQIEEHLAGEGDGFYSRTYRYRPTKMSFEDVTRGRSIEEMWQQAVSSNGRKYFHERVPGERRDRSVSLARTKDGWWHYTGASEHAGMGNGDYYIMYSPTMAFFGESD
jgi:hypothetical protein